MQYLNISEPNFETRFKHLLARKTKNSINIEKDVKNIITDVCARGDEALIDYTYKFDQFDLKKNTIKLDQKTIDEACASIPNEQFEALVLANQRITEFHMRQKPGDDFYHDRHGNALALKWKPIENVGLYVPGGTAAYPSSVLMNAVPARAAGVKRIAMVVPTQKGYINPLVLAAASLNNIDEIYRIGGVQAIGIDDGELFPGRCGLMHTRHH
ncbi:MAG: histidinol dehydrogenase [Pseudomonadota bacterium]